ncbi:MAG: YceH family protein [Thermoanaerobaculia bacterium]
MRTIRELDATEVRVLGALMEKEQATPDYYPLTINALIAACNQKSNREPMTELSETQVVEALDRLRKDVLAWRSDGARVERWSQSISRRLELSSPSKAILTLLMLRGPQTPGQLRSRSGRLYSFSELAEVETTLREMATGDAPLVVELDRRPGTKESRWAHRLGSEPVHDLTDPAPELRSDQPATDPGLSERLAAVEQRVDELARELTRLREELGS